jgi:hypothetical protein
VTPKTCTYFSGVSVFLEDGSDDKRPSSLVVSQHRLSSLKKKAPQKRFSSPMAGTQWPAATLLEVAPRKRAAL